jgi:hypothetical protein
MLANTATTMMRAELHQPHVSDSMRRASMRSSAAEELAE